MKKQLALVAVGLVAVLVLAGQLARANAGPEPNDIQDSLPAWASDGVHLAFQRTSPTLSHVLQMTSAGKDLFVDASSGALRGWVPGTQEKLIQSGDETLVTEGGRFAGPPLAVLRGVDATASPDGKSVAYLREGTLYASSVAGSGERPLATGVNLPADDLAGPTWSPDSRRIVVASGSSLVLVNADGSGSRALFGGAGESIDPSWAPDGALISFERTGAGPHRQIWTVRPDGDPSAQAQLYGSDSDFRFPTFSPVSRQLLYISDRQHLIGGATRYQYALYLTNDLSTPGETAKLVDDVHPYSRPAWSPTAALVAVSAGQECRRWGIYVVRSNRGARAARRSNLCRFTGTAGPDRIGGSYYFDLIRGLGGNDTILARDGNDRIEGNDGDDRIAGGAGNDVLFGGPGNDRLYGGPGNDILIGGPGRDVLDCGPGDDTVQGVSRLDVVSRNCEHVQH